MENKDGVIGTFMGVPVKFMDYPSDESIILFTFDTNIYDLDTIKCAYDNLVELYPKCDIVALPKEITIEYTSKEYLLNLYNCIGNVLGFKE